MTELYDIHLPSGGKLGIKAHLTWADLKPIQRGQPTDPKADNMDMGDYLFAAALERSDTAFSVPYADQFSDPTKPPADELRANDMDKIFNELYRRWIIRSEEKTAMEFVQEIIMAGHMEEIHKMLSEILHPKPQSADPLDGSAKENPERPAA